MTESVVLVVPLAPAVTGNGLAMRAGMLLEILSDAGPVDLVIAPVSGSAVLSPWATERARRVVVVEPPSTPEAARAQSLAQLRDPILRDRLERTQPLPARVRKVPPGLASDVAARLGTHRGRIVVTLREYLAPFGLWLSRSVDARRTVVDLDDDAERVLRQLGDEVEADGFGRLAAAWLGDADMVTAASIDEARAMTERYGVTVTPMPNAVRMPSPEVDAVPDADPDTRPNGRLLFVGNLTYEPNVEAARRLVDEVFPRIRSIHPTATVTLVGAHDDRVAALRGAGVSVTGAVDDVRPFYENADVVVVPLRHGAGTRIKVLEAMAHRRPVVATSTAVGGLDLRDGHDVVVADDPAAMAHAVLALLEDPGRGAQMVTSAFATVARDRTVEAVAPLVRGIVLGHADRTRPGDEQRE